MWMAFETILAQNHQEVWIELIVGLEAMGTKLERFAPWLQRSARVSNAAGGKITQCRSQNQVGLSIAEMSTVISFV